MAVLIKYLNKVPEYSTVNIAKEMILLENKVINSIQVSGNVKKELITARDIYKIMSNDDFEKSYNNALTELIQEEFTEYSSKSVGDLFGPGGQINISSGWDKVKAAEMPQKLDELILTLKRVMKIAFPNISQLNNYTELMTANKQDFFLQLANSFSTMRELYSEGKGAEVAIFVEACKKMAASFPGIANGKTIDKSSFEGFFGNLPSIIGSAIWENVAGIAREKVLKEYVDKIETPALQAFQRSGGTVSVFYHQTGAEKHHGKSIVGDSYVSIELSDNKSNVLMTIDVSDSTKFSQSPHGYYIEPTSTTQILTLGQWLGKIRRRSYWQKRMGAFFKNDNPGQKTKANWRNSDIENWNNTREAIYLRSLYEIVAVRAGGSAVSTFSLNGNIASVANFIQRYAKSARTGQIGNIPNIKLIGCGYENYVQNQMNVSSGSTKTDETILKSNYDDYLKNIMNVKIQISMNIFKGF